MIRQLIRYLFPPIRARQKLPLLPRHYTGEHSRYGEASPDQDEAIRILMGQALARTRQDAHRILRNYPGQPIHVITAAERRSRRREPRLIRAWKRFKELW